VDIPQRAIHFRRLPHVSIEEKEPEKKASADKMKDIWVSRIDKPYREDEFGPFIKHNHFSLELNDGEGTFEGQDASAI
jgi:hypothetical protein